MNPSIPIDPHVAAINGRRCLVPRKTPRIVSHKLSPDEVREIRECLQSGMAHADIAEDYNVSRATIARISSGGSWRHIPEATPSHHTRDCEMRRLYAQTAITPRVLAARYRMTVADVLAILNERSAA